jgi:uncharacterized membrane protein (Fun14 family)
MNDATGQTIESESNDPEHEAERPDQATQLRLQETIDRARRGIRRHPLAAVGVGFGLGFVVGNGIPKFVAQAAVSIGLRALFQRVLEDAGVDFGSWTFTPINTLTKSHSQ